MITIDIDYYKYRVYELEKENLELHKQIQKLVKENTELMNIISTNDQF